MRKVYGDNLPKISAIYHGVEDNERIGRPSTSVCEKQIDAVQDLFEDGPRLTTERTMNE